MIHSYLFGGYFVDCNAMIECIEDISWIRLVVRKIKKCRDFGLMQIDGGHLPKILYKDVIIWSYKFHDIVAGPGCGFYEISWGLPKLALPMISKRKRKRLRERAKSNVSLNNHIRWKISLSDNGGQRNMYAREQKLGEEMLGHCINSSIPCSNFLSASLIICPSICSSRRKRRKDLHMFLLFLKINSFYEIEILLCGGELAERINLQVDLETLIKSFFIIF